MEHYNVNRLTKALGLTRKIIGIRFIPFQQEYDALTLPTTKTKVTFCYMTKKAMAGTIFKVTAKQFRCTYGAYAVGVKQPDIHVTSGRNFYASGLYESKAIAKNAIDSMNYLTQEIYGLVLGPLDEMEQADVVIMMGTAEQVMRIFQGYSYKFGAPHHICSMGNQAMCSDLVAKPFYNNDINLSLLCKGARMHTHAEPGELAVGMPVQMFSAVADGIIMTLNPVEHKAVKEQIIQRLEEPASKELGIEIDFSADYGDALDRYEAYTAKLEKENADIPK